MAANNNFFILVGFCILFCNNNTSLLYSLIKVPARIAFWFYCRKLIVNNKEAFKLNGPLLIAANHPNSFLDAIILDTLFEQPIYSLTRGDVFKSKLAAKILTSLKMLPVYRLREGAENLEHNYTTFTACRKIFENKGIVLIFSEGGCINEWKLRPLKKGTARLALSAWEEGIPLTVLPLGINYSSFRKFGKNIILNFGEPIIASDIANDISHGKGINAFNTKLNDQLKKLVIEVEPGNKEELKKHFYFPVAHWKKILLFIPAALGFIIHAPLYYFVILIIDKIANDHYDSVVMGILFFLYPLYVVLLTAGALYFTNNFWWLGLVVGTPFTAWSLLQVKKQV